MPRAMWKVEIAELKAVHEAILVDDICKSCLSNHASDQHDGVSYF